jgi:DNA repair ATPase RecN
MAAITDHMRCSFATRLSSNVSVPDEFCILPGMEVNLELTPPLNFARIHLLAILAEGSTTESFACLFRDLEGIPRDDASRNGSEEIKGLDLRAWVDRVHGENGLCIAAHVENRQGIRYCFRQTARETLRLFYEGDDGSIERENDVPETFKDYLFASGLDAIEIHRSSDVTHYRWVSEKDGGLRSMATVLRFDAHYCEDFGRADRTTHVKMTSLGLTGLKNALRFPDTRIRFPDNLPPAPNPRLLGISISGDEKSFFEDVKIALAENLNCIIGVRGSGKSTVVEALRYIFGYNRTLQDLGKPMADSIQEMQNANLTGSLIQVAYRLKSEEVRILSATFDEKAEYATKVYNVQGDVLEVADVEECGDYPLRLFGWSEIETLGRSPARQRDLLDRLVRELPSVLRRRESLRQELRKNRGALAKAVEEMKAAFERNGGEIARYKEYQADFDKLNTEEVKDLFSALDLVNDKKRVLEHIRRNAESIAEDLKGLSPLTLRADLDETLEKGSQELREWWLKQELDELGIVAVETDVEKDLREAGEKLKAFLQFVGSHIDSIGKEIEDLQRGLQERLQESSDGSMRRIADLRANAESRLRRVRGIRKEYLKALSQLKDSLEARKGICEELARVQREIGGIRTEYNEEIEETLNRFLPDWMVVSISFKAGGDKDAFGKKLTDAVPGRNVGQVKKTRLALQHLSNPVSCAKAVFDEEPGNLTGRKVFVAGEEIVLSEDDVSTWMASARPFERNEHADVPVLADNGERLERLLELQETPWDDYETILLDGGPVNEKSPGQRSSAMLPLIALAEDTPLVIDQPEDNLDKRLIGTVLMKVLAELKEKRQITVCTHDPNILVGGDAEQVIVLEAESNRKGKVGDHGSIDNDRIVNTVIDLLEGGAEAFETRQRRYGLEGESVTV